MKLIKPIAGQDYGPGFTGFCKTRKHGIMGDLSNVITWMECGEEADEFEKALGESTPDAPSHVIKCIGKGTRVDKVTWIPAGKGGGNDVDLIIHAFTGGVQVSPLSMFLADPDIQVVFREPIDMTPDDANLIIAGAESILGHPYNYPGLIGRGIVAGTPLHHWPWYMRQPLIVNAIERYLGMTESYYCSAAGAHADKNNPKYYLPGVMESDLLKGYVGCPLFQRMDESKIMPSTLYAEGPFKELRYDKEKGGVETLNPEVVCPPK